MGLKKLTWGLPSIIHLSLSRRTSSLWNWASGHLILSLTGSSCRALTADAHLLKWCLMGLSSLLNKYISRMISPASSWYPSVIKHSLHVTDQADFPEQNMNNTSTNNTSKKNKQLVGNCTNARRSLLPDIQYFGVHTISSISDRRKQQQIQEWLATIPGAPEEGNEVVPDFLDCPNTPGLQRTWVLGNQIPQVRWTLKD